MTSALDTLDTLNRSGLAMLADLAPVEVITPAASLARSAADLRRAGDRSAELIEAMVADAVAWPALYAFRAREQAERAARKLAEAGLA